MYMVQISKMIWPQTVGQPLWAHSWLVAQGSLVRFFELVSHCVHHGRAALETQCIIKVAGVKSSQINQILKKSQTSPEYSILPLQKLKCSLFISINWNETYDRPLGHILLDCSASIPVRATVKTIKVMRTKRHQQPQWQIFYSKENAFKPKWGKKGTKSVPCTNKSSDKSLWAACATLSQWGKGPFCVPLPSVSLRSLQMNKSAV